MGVDSPVRRLVTDESGVWAVVTQDLADDAITNHDDFGGVFVGALSMLHDLFDEAGVPIPSSWLPLTTERTVPAGDAFDQSGHGDSLVLVDGVPMSTYVWAGDEAIAGVGVRGWTVLGFAYPAGERGRVELESV